MKSFDGSQGYHLPRYLGDIRRTRTQLTYYDKEWANPTYPSPALYFQFSLVNRQPSPLLPRISRPYSTMSTSAYNGTGVDKNWLDETEREIARMLMKIEEGETDKCFDQEIEPYLEDFKTLVRACRKIAAKCELAVCYSGRTSLFKTDSFFGGVSLWAATPGARSKEGRVPGILRTIDKGLRTEKIHPKKFWSLEPVRF